MLQTMSPSFFSLLIALAVLLFGVFLAFREHKKQARLRSNDDFIDRFLKSKERSLLAIESPITLDAYLVILLIAPIACVIVGYLLTGSELLAVLIGILGFFIPEILLMLAKAQADKRFDESYETSLEVMGSSLQAGMSIVQSVEDVSRNRLIDASMRKRYTKLSSDLAVGVDVGTAFGSFAQESDSIDARDVSLAIDVQNEVGGHEADVIQEIAKNIKNRLMMKKKVRSIMASTSSIVLVLDFLPPIVMVGFFILQPSYRQFYLSSPAHMGLAALCFVLPFIGIRINHRKIKSINRGI